MWSYQDAKLVWIPEEMCDPVNILAAYLHAFPRFVAQLRVPEFRIECMPRIRNVSRAGDELRSETIFEKAFICESFFFGKCETFSRSHMQVRWYIFLLWIDKASWRMEQSNHRSELFGPIVSRSNSKVSRDEIERLGDPVRGRSKSRETTYLTRTLPCTSSHLCFLRFRRTPSARHNSFPESSFQSAICNLGTNAANLFRNGPSLLHFFGLGS